MSSLPGGCATPPNTHPGRVQVDGSITAIEASALLDTGAYLASGAGVARRAGQGILYLYHCANVKYEAHLAYTTVPPQAPTAPSARRRALRPRKPDGPRRRAFRHGPLDFRLKNHVRPEGQPRPAHHAPDQVIDSQPLEGGIPFSSNGLRQCLELGSEAFAGANTRMFPLPGEG